MSRWDSHGMMWEEEIREKKAGGGYASRIKPPIPDGCDWRPGDFPRLEAAKELTIDIETYDPNLKTTGPSVRTGGYIVGIAVATEDASWYFPMDHEKQYDPAGINLPRELVLRWAKRELTLPRIPKLFTNGLYDLDFLWEAGVEIPPPYHDIQIAAPLLDENARSYSLDTLALKHLGQGKPSDELYEWLALAYGGPPTRAAQAGNIYRAPPQLVAKYALGDVELPREIFRLQRKEMEADDLLEIYDLERRLTPLLLAMRRRGVRVAVDAAKDLDHKLMSHAQTLRERLGNEGIDPWSGPTIAAFCDRTGIKYPQTAKGAPSFRSGWLENHGHELIRTIHQVRRLEKHAGTFVEGTVLGNQVNGRIHTQFHPLRSDEFGAVSGRFSSSNPNLQNIPARDDELGPLIRGLFLPEPDQDWYSDDWSQIEFRLLVHYGEGSSAEAVRQRYRSDPTTDFHRYVSELTNIDRRPAKSINFGLVYGMGEPTMAANLGRTLEDVAPMFETYHAELPFIKDLYKKVDRAAATRGWIRTILGRRRRWDLWESTDWKTAKKNQPLPEEAAVQEWGRVRRAGTHKGLNSLLQGGAADIMKKAMVDIWEAGICDELGAPLLTVHDELNWSVPRTLQAEQAHQASLRIMETCVPLKLPLKVSSGKGLNWGEAK